jgi:hypothetical protein
MMKKFLNVLVLAIGITLGVVLQRSATAIQDGKETFKVFVTLDEMWGRPVQFIGDDQRIITIHKDKARYRYFVKSLQAFIHETCR